MPSAHSIFLSRHGESEYMLDDLIGGDSPLTVKGRAYAQQLAEIIVSRLPEASCSDDVPVFTSTLQRTIQTAAHLPFPQQRLSALDEINAGICEHMTYEQVQQRFPAVHEARSRDKLGYRYPQGESYLDLVQRLWPIVHQLEHNQGPVVVVAHQAVLRVVVGLLLRKPLQELPTLSIPLHTVMQLTPTPQGSYNMQHIKAAMPTDAAAAAAAKSTAAAAASAAAGQALEVNHSRSSSSTSSSDSCHIASCMDGRQQQQQQSWNVHCWGSCVSEVQGLQTPAALLTGQEA